MPKLGTTKFQKLETTQMSLNRRMNEQIVRHPYKGILLNNKKSYWQIQQLGWISKALFSNVSKGYILYDAICMTFSKRQNCSERKMSGFWELRVGRRNDCKASQQTFSAESHIVNIRLCGPHMVSVAYSYLFLSVAFVLFTTL